MQQGILVAERRLILARLFKAGEQSHSSFSRGSDDWHRSA